MPHTKINLTCTDLNFLLILFIIFFFLNDRNNTAFLYVKKNIKIILFFLLQNNFLDFSNILKLQALKPVYRFLNTNLCNVFMDNFIYIYTDYPTLFQISKNVEIYIYTELNLYFIRTICTYLQLLTENDFVIFDSSGVAMNRYYTPDERNATS